jgi:hypothetical protein
VDSTLDPSFTTHLLYASIVFLLNIGGFVMLVALLIGLGGEVRVRYKAIYLMIAAGLAVRAIQQLGTIIGYNIYEGNGIYWSILKDLGIYLWISCNLVDYQKSLKERAELLKSGASICELPKSSSSSSFQSLS